MFIFCRVISSMFLVFLCCIICHGENISILASWEELKLFSRNLWHFTRMISVLALLSTFDVDNNIVAVPLVFFTQCSLYAGRTVNWTWFYKYFLRRLVNSIFDNCDFILFILKSPFWLVTGSFKAEYSPNLGICCIN